MPIVYDIYYAYYAYTDLLYIFSKNTRAANYATCAFKFLYCRHHYEKNIHIQANINTRVYI